MTDEDAARLLAAHDHVQKLTRENLSLREMIKIVHPDDWEKRIDEALVDSAIQNLVTTHMAQMLEDRRRVYDAQREFSPTGGNSPRKVTTKPH